MRVLRPACEANSVVREQSRGATHAALDRAGFAEGAGLRVIQLGSVDWPVTLIVASSDQCAPSDGSVLVWLAGPVAIEAVRLKALVFGSYSSAEAS
jgi:hypothetical protein